MPTPFRVEEGNTTTTLIASGWSDYRLICDIQDERITVWVVRVGHRKDVYR